MTNVDLTDVHIKAEPLSPAATQQALACIVLSPSYNTTPSPLPNNFLPSLPPTPFSDASPKQYSSIRSSPMMSSGILKTGQMNQSLPSSPTIPTTPSTSATCTALKSSILQKRLARGELTPVVTTDVGPREYKLTKRDIQRKEARKEQNRRAARRCRMKKKRIQQQASQEMQNAIKENAKMKDVVQTLREQVTQLQQIISEHENTNHCKFSPSHITYSKTESTKHISDSNSLLLDVKSSLLSPCPTSSQDTIFQELFPIVPSNYPDITVLPERLPSTGSNTTSLLSPFMPPSSSSLPFSPINGSNYFTPFAISTPNAVDGNQNSSNLPQDAEIPEDLDEIIKEWLDFSEESSVECNNDTYCKPTPFLRRTEPYPNGQVHIRNTNCESKPAVVRNLNKHFMQNEDRLTCQDKQKGTNNSPSNQFVSDKFPFPNDTAVVTSHLLEAEISPLTLNSVALNTVQPVIPTAYPVNIISNTSTDLKSPKNRHHLQSNRTPLENVTVHQRLTNSPLYSERLGEHMADFPFVHVESPNTPICPKTTSTTNNSEVFSSVHGSSMGMMYQLSPISMPSPSSVSSVPSPGLLQQNSPRDVCQSTGDMGYFSRAPVFDFNC